MCLVVLAIRQSPRYSLILAGNRDEFHARPARGADWWPDEPDVIGGRDLQAGGTWLALHRNGRFATLTNYRDAEPPVAGARSRGCLVMDFLACAESPLDYLHTIEGERYAGFNLIVGDENTVAYSSNRGAEARELNPGIYGLSNALLDGPWDKIERSKARLKHLLDRDEVNETTILRLLNDRKPAPAEEVEAGPLDFSTRHAITAPFIVTPEYGTRCSTVVLADGAGSWHLTERRFDATGAATGDSRYSFSSAPMSAKH